MFDSKKVIESLLDSGIDPDHIRVRNLVTEIPGSNGEASKYRIDPAMNADGRPMTLRDVLQLHDGSKQVLH